MVYRLSSDLILKANFSERVLHSLSFFSMGSTRNYLYPGTLLSPHLASVEYRWYLSERGGSEKLRPSSSQHLQVACPHGLSILQAEFFHSNSGLQDPKWKPGLGQANHHVWYFLLFQDIKGTVGSKQNEIGPLFPFTEFQAIVPILRSLQNGTTCIFSYVTSFNSHAHVANWIRSRKQSNRPFKTWTAFFF